MPLRGGADATVTSMRPLVLGLDGGNTKSVAVVAGIDGEVLGTGRAGCGDIYGSTVDAALAELDAAIEGALREAGASHANVVAAGCSLAGADWPEDFVLLEGEMRRRLPRVEQVVVVNDAIGALRAGTVDGEGVAVVVGTGSAIGARSGGTTWHASFWGEDGGAGTLGRAALRALVRSDLGLDPPVGFTSRALDVFDVSSVEALLYEATRRGGSRTLLAGLAPTLLDAADAGDPVGRDIVVRVGRVLGEYARLAARRVGLGEGGFPVVLAGGVFRHPSMLIRDEIRSALPGAASRRERVRTGRRGAAPRVRSVGERPRPGPTPALAPPPRAVRKPRRRSRHRHPAGKPGRSDGRRWLSRRPCARRATPKRPSPWTSSCSGRGDRAMRRRSSRSARTRRSRAGSRSLSRSGPPMPMRSSRTPSRCGAMAPVRRSRSSI